MNSNKNKTSGVAITFYVIAVVLLVAFAFNIYNTYQTIQEYLTSYQMVFSDAWEMFVSSYLQACLPAFVGAVLCYGVATILVKLENTQNALLACVMDADSKEEVETIVVEEPQTVVEEVEEHKEETIDTLEEEKNA